MSGKTSKKTEKSANSLADLGKLVGDMPKGTIPEHDPAKDKVVTAVVSTLTEDQLDDAIGQFAELAGVSKAFEADNKWRNARQLINRSRDLMLTPNVAELKARRDEVREQGRIITEFRHKIASRLVADPKFLNVIKAKFPYAWKQGDCDKKGNELNFVKALKPADSELYYQFLSKVVENSVGKIHAEDIAKLRELEAVVTGSDPEVINDLNLADELGNEARTLFADAKRLDPDVEARFAHRYVSDALPA